ncbi:MAG: hypothetical protein Q8L14_11375 [Myxococcales bacterium]|nr:hypothetical protein [Myxococcales bacterium]
MRLLVTLVWTLSCVGVGIALSTVEVSGRTPWQRAQKLWKSDGEKRLGEAREQATGLVADVTKKVSSSVKDLNEKPLDRHSPAERDALEKLIANRQRDGK